MRARPIDVELDAVPSAIADAREAIDALAGSAPDTLVENTRLLVSELVTNSVRHAGLEARSRIGLRAEYDGRTLRVEVCDPGPGFEPKEQAITFYQQSGWGLYLVQQIADRWGVRRDGPTCVWFELDARPAGRQSV